MRVPYSVKLKMMLWRMSMSPWVDTSGLRWQSQQKMLWWRDTLLTGPKLKLAISSPLNLLSYSTGQVQPSRLQLSVTLEEASVRSMHLPRVMSVRLASRMVQWSTTTALELQMRMPQILALRMRTSLTMMLEQLQTYMPNWLMVTGPRMITLVWLESEMILERVRERQGAKRMRVLLCLVKDWKSAYVLTRNYWSQWMSMSAPKPQIFQMFGVTPIKSRSNIAICANMFIDGIQMLLRLQNELLLIRQIMMVWLEYLRGIES